MLGDEGVFKYIKRFEAGSTAVDTGISINAGYGGGAVLVLSTTHSGSEDHTYAQLDLIRFGYSGNHYTVENIKASGGDCNTSFGVSNDKHLTVYNTINTVSKIIIIYCK